MNGEEAYFLSRAYTDKNSVDPTNYYDKTTTDTLLSAKADASTTYTKTEADNLLKNKVDWEGNGVLGAKNLLPLSLATIKSLNTTGTWSSNVYTLNGVDFTVNSDMSITVSGTATANAPFVLSYPNYKKGKYIVTKFANDAWYNPDDGTYNYMALIWHSDFGTAYITDEDTEVEFNSDLTGVQFALRVASGTTITDAITFYPMLRLATDTDTTYQPYAMTNRELTERVNGIYKNYCLLTANGGSESISISKFATGRSYLIMCSGNYNPLWRYMGLLCIVDGSNGYLYDIVTDATLTVSVSGSTLTLRNNNNDNAQIIGVTIMG